jgi:hypothetical protein
VGELESKGSKRIENAAANLSNMPTSNIRMSILLVSIIRSCIVFTGCNEQNLIVKSANDMFREAFHGAAVGAAAVRSGS